MNFKVQPQTYSGNPLGIPFTSHSAADGRSALSGDVVSQDVFAAMPAASSSGFVLPSFIDINIPKIPGNSGNTSLPGNNLGNSALQQFTPIQLPVQQAVVQPQAQAPMTQANPGGSDQLLTVIKLLIKLVSGKKGAKPDEADGIQEEAIPGAKTNSKKTPKVSSQTGSLFKGGKEGLGISPTSSNGDGSNMVGKKASWYYNWASSPTDKVKDPNATFIPMIWGRKEMTDKDLQAAANSKSPMILTFNEPDHGEQAKMSVDEALGYWDKLEATGKQLTSPAVTNGPDGVKWLDEFMAKAKAQGKRVDSISVHWYGNSAQPTGEKVAALKAHLEMVHKKYPDMPINLTEFGVDAQGLTAKRDQAFLTEAEKMLNELDYVQMYAPYGAGEMGGNG